MDIGQSGESNTNADNFGEEAFKNIPPVFGESNLI
jgi:hypothetical protein